MKANYQIKIMSDSSDNEQVRVLNAYTSRTVAKRLYYALSFYCNQKPYKRISLALVSPLGDLEVLCSCEVCHG